MREHMSMDTFRTYVYEELLEDYLRKFSTLKDDCPPKSLTDDNIDCFYCLDCFVKAKERLLQKDNKNK